MINELGSRKNQRLIAHLKPSHPCPRAAERRRCLPIRRRVPSIQKAVSDSAYAHRKMGAKKQSEEKRAARKSFFLAALFALDDSPAVSRGGGVSNVEPLFAAALINSARYLRAQKGAATSAWKWSSAGEGEGRRTEDTWEKIDRSEREREAACNSGRKSHNN